VKTRWVAITGGPSAGKTTLRDALSIEGYTTKPDAARVHANAEKSLGRPLAEVRADPVEFQEAIIELKLRMYSKMDKSQQLIIDGPLEDCMVFYRRAGGDPDRYAQYVGKWRYAAVLFCEPSVAESDGVRTEGLEESREIGRELLELYRSLGYEPVVLKADTSLPKRLETVKTRLGSP
jgi:predicted ATPase